MKSFWVCCFFCVSRLWAAQGVVETSDGLRIEGEINSEPGFLIVKTTNHAPSRLAVTNISHLQMAARSNDVKTAIQTEGKVHGLTATYFRSADLTGEKVKRIDPAIDFDWQEKPPIEVNPGESFSVRWEGEIEAPVSEKFTFHVEGNDQIKLWVGPHLVINSHGNPGSGETTGTVTLEGGKLYPFKMEFREKNWSASAKVSWSTASMPKAPVPPDSLYTLPAEDAAGLQNSGLLGIYFSKPNLTGDFKVRVDASIDFDWEENPPIPGLEPNQYSVRWEGDLIPETSESYTFEFETEEKICLWLDGHLLLQSGTDKSRELVSLPVILKAGEKYHVRIEILEMGSEPTARLFWSSSSLSRSVIPASYFTP
ncbi:MAG TPA: PA14 domain-containing protein, partial [Candidatus Saccharimonadales bacterium]|nr:PA14 domain-containing protein [Candidatus Saccharimonadales bacterium]